MRSRRRHTPIGERNTPPIRLQTETLLNLAIKEAKNRQASRSNAATAQRAKFPTALPPAAENTPYNRLMAAPQNATVQSVDKMFMENTLLRVTGALFCHDIKRASTHVEPITLNPGIDGKLIKIRPDPELGQPGQLAHKVFVALIKKHSDYGLPVQHEISFSKRELSALIGRTNWGGHYSEQLSRALYQIHRTFVAAYFKKSDGRFVEHSFTIFPEIILERREFASDPIEACTVRLAEPIVESLQEQHFTCLNYELMQRLATIGQALYLRLFFHFANLYDGKNDASLVLQKRYDAICTEWLGGLKVLEHKSRILNDQLGAHLAELVEAGFLKSYSIDRAKEGEGFVLSFWPGELFFEDYDYFYRRQGKRRRSAPSLAADQQTIGEPMRVAQLFAERRDGRPLADGFVSSTDVSTARELLAAISIDDMPTFMDYALKEAKKTGFAVQRLGGLKQYLPSYLAWQEKATARRAQATARATHDREEAKKEAYQRARREEAEALFETLPSNEQQDINVSAQAFAARYSGSLQNSMMSYHKTRLIIERCGNRLSSFEQWQARTPQ
jgi:hypothetical protein